MLSTRACFKNRLVSGQTNRAVRRGNHGLQGVGENCFPPDEEEDPKAARMIDVYLRPAPEARNELAQAVRPGYAKQRGSPGGATLLRASSRIAECAAPPHPATRKPRVSGTPALGLTFILSPTQGLRPGLTHSAPLALGAGFTLLPLQPLLERNRFSDSTLFKQVALKRRF
jgi:hypothetical protein